jgi:O-antigen ligase
MGIWTLALPILIVAALEAAWGLLLFFQGAGTQDSAHGTYENRNHFAGLLEMALPLAIMYAVAVYRRSRTTASSLKACAVLALATLILVGIIYSFSRMGFVACLISLFLMGILALKNRVTKRWLAGALVLCLALLAFIYLPPDQLIERFGRLWDGQELTTEGRLYIWGEALPLLKAYPVFGCGLGGFESVFSQYQRSVPDRRVDFAHNDYLQYLVELGILGFLIAAVLIGRIFIRLWREIYADEDSEEHALAVGCIAALAAILIHSFVDFNLYVPANAMTMAWISGILSTD